MSLLHQAAAIVKRDGTSSADQIVAEIHGVTRQQVLIALNNARAKGLVHCVGRVEGYKAGQQPGVFAPGPAPEKPAPVVTQPRPHVLHSIWAGHALHG